MFVPCHISMCAIPRGDSLLSTQEVLSVNKNASELRLADLETQWEEDHIAILHSNQDKLHIDPEGVKRIDGYTPCAQLAYCACRQPAVGKFCQKLLAGMKKKFRMISKNVPSVERALLDSGFIVVRLASQARELFFHIGYVNFRRWHFSCLKLHRNEGKQRSDDPLLLSVGDPSSVHCDEPEPWTHDISTIFSFVGNLMDLELPWKLQYFEILSDDRVIPFDLMPSRFVSVAPLCNGGAETDLWMGHAMESARRSRNPYAFGKNPEAKPKAHAGRAKRPKLSDDGSAPVDADPLEDLLVDDPEEAGSDEEHKELEEEFVDHVLKADQPEREDSEQENDELDKLLQEGPVEAGLDVPVPIPDLLRDMLEDEDFQPPPQNAAGPERAGRAAEAGPRAAKVPEEFVVVPGYRELRYNYRGFIRAHCPCHGAECRRQRQTNRGRKAGSGRPVGALVAWLKSADHFEDQASHVLAPVASFAERRDCREWFFNRGGKDFSEEHESNHSPELDGPDLEPRIIT
jgi:hypothetical protein